MEGVRLRESQKYIVRERARGADGEIDRERGKGRGIDVSNAAVVFTHREIHAPHQNGQQWIVGPEQFVLLRAHFEF